MNNIKQALESAIAFVDWYAPEQELLFELKAALAEVEASSTNRNSNVLLDKCEPQKQWVGLNYLEILDCLPDDAKRVPEGWQMFYENIEAKLKELNT